MFPPVDFELQSALRDANVPAAIADWGGCGPPGAVSFTPVASPAPDAAAMPPEPKDSRRVFRIDRTAYRFLMRYLITRPPEAAGALLGPKGANLVTRFVPDRWGQATPASFTFGTAGLNRSIRRFIIRGEDVKGLVHSHPHGCTRPSGGDLIYLDRLFRNPKHDDVREFWFPIVEGGAFRPFIALRDEAGGPVRIVEARLEIVTPPVRTRKRVKPGPLDTTRIRPLIDIVRMATRTVTLVGTGGGANLARNLARSNLGCLNLIDFDSIEGVNICRQEHMADTTGWLKVDALAAELGRINPGLHVRCFPRNFCEFTDADIDRLFGDTDLFVFAVDNLAANARGNEVALRLGKPAVWSGLYAGGRAGEIAFWKPGLPCYRCLCGARYAALDRGQSVGQPVESADIFAVQFLDSVAGMIALGLLTEGADNGYGRLITRLDRRNFLQLKIAPDWTWKGRDVFREQLQVPADCPAYFSFLTIAREDPAGGQPPCPDCVRFRKEHSPDPNAEIRAPGGR